MQGMEWPLQRVVVLFVSLAFLIVGVQVTLSHYRQSFHHKAMWAPVVAAPLFCITALALVFLDADWLLRGFLVLMWIGVLIGGVGVYYHVHGVSLRVGGFTSRNFLTGPPVALPLLFAGLSVLGLIACYWR